MCSIRENDKRASVYEMYKEWGNLYFPLGLPVPAGQNQQAKGPVANIWCGLLWTHNLHQHFNHFPLWMLCMFLIITFSAFRWGSDGVPALHSKPKTQSVALYWDGTHTFGVSNSYMHYTNYKRFRMCRILILYWQRALRTECKLLSGNYHYRYCISWQDLKLPVNRITSNQFGPVGV